MRGWAVDQPEFRPPMTIEDVNWLLRYPSDELVMSQETLNKINAAIGSAKYLTEQVHYSTGLDGAGRMKREPSTLADRKLTMNREMRSGEINIRVKDKPLVWVYFPD